MPAGSRFSGAALAAALLLAAPPAHAHSFGTGADAFTAFVEGSGTVLFSPVTLLPCLSLGLLLSLWQVEGMLKAWPLLILGHIAGFLLAPAVGPWVIPAQVALGTGAATLAALLPRHVRAEAFVLTLATGLLTMSVSLEGHAWFELPLTIYLGIFAAASFAVAAGAGLARLAVENIRSTWAWVGLRVAGSWLAAIQLLMLAFLVSQGP